MSERAAAFVAKLAALPTDVARVNVGIVDLHELLRDLIRAYAPPNVQFERERIIARSIDPREIAFVLGLSSEGENEAALLLDLICAVSADDPRAQVGHLVDEAWYYLRTSIDDNWQLDDAAPNAGAALAYLFTVFDERLATLRALPAARSLATDGQPERAVLLRALRRELSQPTAGSSR